VLELMTRWISKVSGILPRLVGTHSYALEALPLPGKKRRRIASAG
jgi:hypothetical protein